MANSFKAVLQTGLLCYFKLQGSLSAKELAEHIMQTIKARKYAGHGSI
jgi:hypothetical protein